MSSGMLAVGRVWVWFFSPLHMLFFFFFNERIFNKVFFIVIAGGRVYTLRFWMALKRAYSTVLYLGVCLCALSVDLWCSQKHAEWCPVC